MIGNLHLYEGPVEVAEYGEALRDLGGDLLPRTLLLWVMRLGLMAMFALHIHSAYSLQRMSRKANISGGHQTYVGGQNFLAADFASRTMRWTGPIIGLYLLYHLADLTWGWFSWTDYVRGDPYHNVAESLGNWPVAILYIVANTALAVHIYHGTWSLFQSLGINNPRYNNARKGLASGLAGIILIGNLSFPIMVQAGLIDEDNCDSPCGLVEEHGGESAESGAEA
jgi:succinate dehydrogenase / fumarate reductase cytochrome b subunit